MVSDQLGNIEGYTKCSMNVNQGPVLQRMGSYRVAGSSVAGRLAGAYSTCCQPGVWKYRTAVRLRHKRYTKVLL